jgi:hypothetical protein
MWIFSLYIPSCSVFYGSVTVRQAIYQPCVAPGTNQALNVRL